MTFGSAPSPTPATQIAKNLVCERNRERPNNQIISVHTHREHRRKQHNKEAIDGTARGSNSAGIGVVLGDVLLRGSRTQQKFAVDEPNARDVSLSAKAKLVTFLNHARFRSHIRQRADRSATAIQSKCQENGQPNTAILTNIEKTDNHWLLA